MNLAFGSSAVAIACFVVGLGHAAPPPNANPAFSRWFGSLVDPDTGISCCGEADCRAAEERMGRDGFEVRIEGRWLAVPAEKILHRPDNPTGQAVLCYSKALGIMCFVPGIGV